MLLQIIKNYLLNRHFYKFFKLSYGFQNIKLAVINLHYLYRWLIILNYCWLLKSRRFFIVRRWIRYFYIRGVLLNHIFEIFSRNHSCSVYFQSDHGKFKVCWRDLVIRNPFLQTCLKLFESKYLILVCICLLKCIIWRDSLFLKSLN